MTGYKIISHDNGPFSTASRNKHEKVLVTYKLEDFGYTEHF